MAIIISCAECGYFIENNATSCPKCGSIKRVILIDLLADPKIRNEISFSIVNHHKVWTYLPKTIQFHINNLSGDPGRTPIEGLCLDIIVSTASLIEGVITDHIVDELESNLFDISKKITNEAYLKGIHYKGWNKKKAILDYLNWDISSLVNFDIVDNLFMLRNNIAHGKGYQIIDERGMKNHVLVRKGSLTIENINYFNVYKFLAGNKIVPDLDDALQIQIDYFLTPEIAKYFYDGSVQFLNDFFKNIKLSSRVNIQPEFERAFR